MRPLIVVLAKAPAPGKVKTRLGIDPADAARLYAALVRNVLGTVQELNDVADLELSTEPATDAWSDVEIARSVQPGGDLGQRLYCVLERALGAGRAQAMIVGGDSPLLPAAYLRVLLSSQADVALGPAADGGYYAIACRTLSPSMFDGVRWSTESALADTLRAVAACGLTRELGPQWFDVDRPEDLRNLWNRLGELPEARRDAELMGILTPIARATTTC